MTEGTIYRGIGYSTAANGNGTWRWKIHPPKDHAAGTITGGLCKSEDEATAAVKSAIPLSQHSEAPVKGARLSHAE